jgi:hypothetical protein
MLTEPACEFSELRGESNKWKMEMIWYLLSSNTADIIEFLTIIIVTAVTAATIVAVIAIVATASTAA